MIPAKDSSKMKAKKSAAHMITGRKPSDALQRSVVRYIESRGGSVLVVGEIQIQQWPGELPCNFTIAVKCTGRKPDKPK